MACPWASNWWASIGMNSRSTAPRHHWNAPQTGEPCEPQPFFQHRCGHIRATPTARTFPCARSHRSRPGDRDHRRLAGPSYRNTWRSARLCFCPAHGPPPAFVFVEHGLRCNWRKFSEAVDRVAAGLLCQGAQRGEHLGIWSPNRPEWVLTQFATARLGVILVNINPAYRSSELEYALNEAGVHILISAVGLKSSDYLGMLRDLAPELADCAPGKLQAKRLPELRSVVQMGRCAQP